MKTLIMAGALGLALLDLAAAAKKESQPPLVFPPALPENRPSATDSSPDFLKPPASWRGEAEIAKTAPKVDFLFYPGQDYEGKPWSVWGDGCAVEGKYYSAIGDHLSPAGNAVVFEFDARRLRLERLLDLQAVLKLPPDHYRPGKIHSRVDLGSDGWLYFSTHRGSVRGATEQYHYQGDWVLRHEPTRRQTEVVAHAPVPKHSIPASRLDPQRLVFYGGTAPSQGLENEGVRFFAWDIRQKRLLYTGPNGPERCLAVAVSSGRVYFNPAKSEDALARFDPANPAPPVTLPVTLGMRAATDETPGGFIYTVSSGQNKREAVLYALNTRAETVENLGKAAVGSQQYITTLDADPSGRFLYYVPGAHGGSETDGTPVVQFDTQTRRKKVLAFLHPFFQQKYGCTLKGTFSAVVDPQGDKLYVTWNVSRGSRAWDCCALTVIHIPEGERKF